MVRPRRRDLVRAAGTASWVFAVGAAANRSVAGDLGCPADSALVFLSAGGGVQDVGAPSFDPPHEDFGTRPQLVFAVGWNVRAWLEPFAEVAYVYLEGSDSLDAVIASGGGTGKSVGTLVESQLGLRVRWARCARLQPHARIGAGVATQTLSAGGDAGSRANDFLWSAGGGADLWLHRHLVLRAEGLLSGQAASTDTYTHLAGSLAVAYVFTRGILRP